MTISGMIFKRLQPVSKKVRVVAALKDAIVSGTLQSGDQIVEVKLAQEFGVGQGLIREALIELEYQGFVQRSPFAWTQVTTLTNEDARDIFDIRIEVEPLAFDLAARRASQEERSELSDLVAKARQGVASGELDVFFENHLAYRRRIWHLSGNRFLTETLERLVAPLYALYLMRADFNREGLIETIHDCIRHQEDTLRAFEAGNPREAANIVRRFLRQMKGNLGSRLLSMGKDEGSTPDASG
jgi:DNA-binding GntR family transcriptional regulator